MAGYVNMNYLRVLTITVAIGLLSSFCVASASSTTVSSSVASSLGTTSTGTTDSSTSTTTGAKSTATSETTVRSTGSTSTQTTSEDAGTTIFVSTTTTNEPTTTTTSSYETSGSTIDPQSTAVSTPTSTSNVLTSSLSSSSSDMTSTTVPTNTSSSSESTPEMTSSTSSTVSNSATSTQVSTTHNPSSSFSSSEGSTSSHSTGSSVTMSETMTTTAPTMSVASSTPTDDTSTGSETISTTVVTETTSYNTTGENITTTTENVTTTFETTTIDYMPSQPEASSESTSSSISPKSTAPMTTTTPTTTTTTTVKYPPVPANIDSATFTLSFRLEFVCSNFNLTMIEIEFKQNDFLSVTLKAVNGSCTNDASTRRKRYVTNEAEYQVKTAILAKQGNARNNTESVLTKLHEDGLISNATNITKIANNVASQTSHLCDADNYCPSGYKCPIGEKNSTDCFFLCDPMEFSDPCGNNGVCYVEVGSNNSVHATKCRCNTDTFYQYGGAQCETKEMTWQMVLAIAGGCAGAIIVILVFVIIVTCMRKKRTNGYNKYSNGGDLHYMDLQGPHQRSTRDYQGLRHSDDRPYPGNAQGYENKAYDYRDYIEADSDLHYRTGAHAPNGSRATNGSRSVNGSRERWNPDESADTYARINQQLNDAEFKYNIKRAQLKKPGDGTDVRTGF